MNPKVLFSGAVLVAFIVSVGLYSATGTGDTSLLAAAGAFDDKGYNRTARVFQGTGGSWCTANNQPEDCMGAYSDDVLTFSWNSGWDKGNREAWVQTPYSAEMNIEFANETFTVTWVGSCRDGAAVTGGTCVWGEFAISGDPTRGALAEWVRNTSPSRY